ncbi:hypothetical protein P280DRAFT_484963 [Massarina eburnea CBS 473.64]|uniref:Uncharacterized protein n=1 Tax=Massarina eburnea CBS 473.64 TaxID=1395130 RepID=A0A6A6RIA0_9PLEO|nr:hypothetical protein P280DRAFT_484963 [Massarina eburnea CBS 473.64]
MKLSVMVFVTAVAGVYAGVPLPDDEIFKSTIVYPHHPTSYPIWTNTTWTHTKTLFSTTSTSTSTIKNTLVTSTVSAPPFDLKAADVDGASTCSTKSSSSSKVHTRSKTRTIRPTHPSGRPTGRPSHSSPLYPTHNGTTSYHLPSGGSPTPSNTHGTPKPSKTLNF